MCKNSLFAGMPSTMWKCTHRKTLFDGSPYKNWIIIGVQTQRLVESWSAQQVIMMSHSIYRRLYSRTCVESLWHQEMLLPPIRRSHRLTAASVIGSRDSTRLLKVLPVLTNLWQVCLTSLLAPIVSIITHKSGGITHNLIDNWYTDGMQCNAINYSVH